ncbi:hypothetical protein [Sphingomicrobium astaxanthinifaciens]|uniref:hypothetical protein n=1 Tax=Sphingomicrobium astaxanthinifaciens TaxID=1227949 RepID=UPI001FCB7037|nr:hypothetical protein [Sphingomicrobium astaxanthinifaciens]MCJ7421988.1 hypothetical protein [Sphingomicrobium astaxanthinifaciens]
MSIEEGIAAVERQAREMERLPAVQERTNAALDRADRVLGGIDSPTRRRDLEQMGRDLTNALVRAGLAIGVVSLLTIGVGMVVPIGLFGFLAAVGIAIGLAAIVAFFPRRAAVTMGEISARIGNADLVARFDRFLAAARRDLPTVARAELDALRARAKAMARLLDNADAGDPQVADARRLMSQHLPLLIERYEQVPESYRLTRDNEGLTANQRLADGLRSGREALEELGESLARKDVHALESHGRFLKNRYGEKKSEFDR